MKLLLLSPTEFPGTINDDAVDKEFYAPSHYSTTVRSDDKNL